MGDPTQTGATSDINNGPLAELAAEANGFVDDLVAWRRDIHANPELGLDNPRTRDLIIEALAPLSLPIRTGEQASWVAADIVGDPDGPTILLRADTDVTDDREQRRVVQLRGEGGPTPAGTTATWPCCSARHGC